MSQATLDLPEREKIAPVAAHSSEVEARLQPLLDALAIAVLEREEGGSYGKAERELLRHSGLLAAAIPVAYGGLGLDWLQICAMLRRIAVVDGTLAYFFGTHHLQIAGLALYGSPTQHEHMFGRTLSDQGFWGDATAARAQGVKALLRQDGFILEGRKDFSPSAKGSDYLLVTAALPDGKNHIYAAVASLQRGVVIEKGGVTFESVSIAQEAVLTNPLGNSRSLGVRLAQHMRANLEDGIAQGVLKRARSYVLDFNLPETAFQS